MANGSTKDSRRKRMHDYLLENPGCTTDDVSQCFAMPSRETGQELYQLVKQNRAKSERIEGTTRVRWFAIERIKSPPIGETPHRPTVTSWAPHMHRCPLVASLFGMAPAQVAA